MALPAAMLGASGGAGGGAGGGDASMAPIESGVRVARELNPYAREGVSIDKWSAEGAGVDVSKTMTSQGTSQRGAEGTDGGASWQEKKLRRAVEEAESSGRALEAVCQERFGSLELLPRMKEILRAGTAQPLRGAAGGHPLAHLHQQRDRRREGGGKGKGGGKGAEEDDGGGSGGGFGGGKGGGKGGEASLVPGARGGGRGRGMMRPKVGVRSREWRGSRRRRRLGTTAHAAGCSSAAAPTAGVANAFSNDGSFLKQFQRREFLYGGSKEAPSSSSAAAEEVPKEEEGGLPS